MRPPSLSQGMTSPEVDSEYLDPSTGGLRIGHMGKDAEALTIVAVAYQQS